MTGILMTQVSTPIIGQAAWLLGKIMDGIYRVMDLIGIHNLGVCIILLTIVIYTLLMPLTIKQQKFSKMSAAMNPELQKVQQKYKGKNDQASMQKMQEETQLVYEKYGVSSLLMLGRLKRYTHRFLPLSWHRMDGRRSWKRSAKQNRSLCPPPNMITLIKTY